MLQVPTRCVLWVLLCMQYVLRVLLCLQVCVVVLFVFAGTD